jgi:FSR family fosmidomycin resistance protein-like MFS transporter
LVVLEAADLLGDVFHGYLALYFVDVARVDAAAAAFGLAVWTAGSLVGDALLLLVLRRMRGATYLRVTALAVLVAYPAFLLVPGYGAKLVLAGLLGLLNAGWYAIPQAGLYEVLPGRSGAAVAVGGLGGLFGASVPLVLGFVAGTAGSRRRCGFCWQARQRCSRSCRVSRPREHRLHRRPLPGRAPAIRRARRCDRPHGVVPYPDHS